MSLSHALGWAAPLHIQVDGVNTTRTVFCVGDDITLTCTVPSVVHVWTVPGYESNAAIVARSSAFSFAPFLLEFESILPNSDIISSLSFIVISDLDGITITCWDDTELVNPETQTSTLTVLSKAMLHVYNVIYGDKFNKNYNPIIK